MEGSDYTYTTVHPAGAGPDASFGGLVRMGDDPSAALTAVKDWAENHFDEVHAARERYDEDTDRSGQGVGRQDMSGSASVYPFVGRFDLLDAAGVQRDRRRRGAQGPPPACQVPVTVTQVSAAGA
ncbi:hypothetical protein SVIOM74S_01299 [Streptomyces violarus]